MLTLKNCLKADVMLRQLLSTMKDRVRDMDNHGDKIEACNWQRKPLHLWFFCPKSNKRVRL